MNLALIFEVNFQKKQNPFRNPCTIYDATVYILRTYKNSLFAS